MNRLLVQGCTLFGIQAVIFDKDGTLADSRSFLFRLAHLRANLFFTTLKAAGLALEQDSLQGLYQIFGVAGGLDPDGLMAAGSRQANQAAAAQWLIQAGYSGDQVDRQVADVFQAADNQLQPKVASTPPFQGTVELLDRLAKSGLKLGVLSSDSTAHVEDFLEFYQLKDWIDGWRGTEREDPAKPDPTLFYQLCDSLQVPPQATVIVGDSWVDLSLAEQGGAAAFISVSEAWGRSPVPGSQLVVRSWSDLSVVSTNLDHLQP
ncbi:MAG: HAD family hydrolase [Nodosilinea sp.]